ncbi:DMT family transporter [Actinoalloteichus caeruleus]|uniref:DMT family transporter n=1 Tax=Actinoalloteichus cyanogriseus TaxID=2893586 RepID=UPI003AAC9FCC
MVYLLLAVAIAAEVTATVALRFSEGFSRLIPSIIVVVGYVIAFRTLAEVLKRGMPIGTAYAMWAGIGVAAVAVIGALFLGEQLTLVKIAGLVLVVGGVVLLELGGGHGDPGASSSVAAEADLDTGGNGRAGAQG